MAFPPMTVWESGGSNTIATQSGHIPVCTLSLHALRICAD